MLSMCEVVILDDKIKEKYQVQISEAETFLSSKVKGAARKIWSPMQRKKWLMRKDICPTCGIKLDDKNLTKEHIHPLCLGGAERDDNVIAMCHECNDSRNQTMSDVLGGNKPALLRKRWPANRSSVEEFVVWCHATVYHDVETVSTLQHIEESFNKRRGFKKSKSLITRSSNKEQKEPVFKSVSRFFSKIKSKLSKPSSKVKVDCDKCGSVLQVPRDYSGRFKCPSCSHINGNETKVKVESKSKSSESSSPIVTIPSDLKESESSLKDSFRKYILQKLSETGRIDLGVLVKPHLDNFVEENGFTKFSLVKVAMGYSLNKKMKDILADTCGESVIFTSEQVDDNPPKIYVELASKVEVATRSKSSERSSPITASPSDSKESESSLKDSFRKYILQKLSEIGRINLSNLGNKAADSLVIEKGFTKFSELKVAMGYSLNKRLRDIVLDVCGDSVIFTSEQVGDNPPKIYVETAFNLKVELWNQIEDAILTNKREITDLDYVWPKVSFWSKTVGFSGAAELKKELGYSSKAKVVDLITELYGDKLQISTDGEKIQLRLNTND